MATDYISYAQMKPDTLNTFLDLSGRQTLETQKKITTLAISELAKTIQAQASDLESLDVLIRIKEAGLRFGDIIKEYTEEQLEYLVDTCDFQISPLYTWMLVGVVGKWAVLQDIHSIRNARKNVENFPTKNFIKK